MLGLFKRISNLFKLRKETRLRQKEYYAFAKNNPDWDYIYLFDLLKFKLSRIEKCLRTGFCDQHALTLKSLKVCIRLCDRISKEKYNYAIRQHEKKFPSHYDSFSFEVIKDFQKALEADTRSRERDVRLLFQIISKYYIQWWD